MIPLWMHILTVLALLASNALMYMIFKRRIESLRLALVAKRALLGEPAKTGSYSIAPGDVLCLKSEIGYKIADIRANGWCSFDLELYV